MKRSTPLKRKTPLKRVSKKRRWELGIYWSKAQWFLRMHPYCQMGSCLRPATQIHHIRGRNGSRLNDDRYWLALCNDCHQWIHFQAPQEARKIGALST